MSASDGIKKWEIQAYHSKTEWKRTVIKEKASAVALSWRTWSLLFGSVQQTLEGYVYTGDWRQEAPLLPIQIGQIGAKLHLEAVQKHQHSTKRAPEAEGPFLWAGGAQVHHPCQFPIPRRVLVRRWVRPRNSPSWKPGQEQQQEQICIWPGAIVPSQAGGRECIARDVAGRQADPLARQGPTFREQGLGSASTAPHGHRWRAPKPGLPWWNSCQSQGSECASDYPDFQTHLVMPDSFHDPLQVT